VLSTTTVTDVIDEYLEGSMAQGELFGRLVDVLLGGDIEVRLATAPPETRDWLEWGLHKHYAPIHGRTAEDYIYVEGSTSRDPAAALARREAHEREFREVRLPRLQAWCRAHAPSPREQFPLDVFSALHARVTAEHLGLWARRPKGPMQASALRAWAERDREAALGDQRSALDAVLGLAKPGGTGGLEEALAWMGLERVAGSLANRGDLTMGERDLIVAAMQRREAHLDSIGRSTPDTPGLIPGDLEP
jgi:hypothetical protein